jgi:ribonuclease D
MWASRILGWPAHGLADLLQAHFGVSLNKKYQRANWGLRPLPPDQLSYARLDTHYLLPLYELQAKHLSAAKRWPQAHHRFAKLVQTRSEPKHFDPDGFWRLPGVRDLDDQGRGVLRELYLWRDRCAQGENRPAFKVVSNKVLVAVSVERPQNLGSLQQIRGMSHSMVGRYGRGLLTAIGRGMEKPLAWAERPRSNNGLSHGANGHPSAACQARFEALRAWRNAAAQARGVEPDIVLNNQTLWAVAHRNPHTRAELAADSLLARWQVKEFGDELLAVLKAPR